MINLKPHPGENSTLPSVRHRQLEKSVVRAKEVVPASASVLGTCLMGIALRRNVKNPKSLNSHLDAKVVGPMKKDQGVLDLSVICEKEAFLATHLRADAVQAYLQARSARSSQDTVRA